MKKCMKWVREGFLEEAGMILEAALKEAYAFPKRKAGKRTFQTGGRRQTNAQDLGASREVGEWPKTQGRGQEGKVDSERPALYTLLDQAPLLLPFS